MAKDERKAADKDRRQVARRWDPAPKQKGQKRRHRSIEEKLRRYEAHAEGYEFIPALMHSLQRATKDCGTERHAAFIVGEWRV